MKAIILDNYDIAVNITKDSAGKITSGWVLGDVLLQNQAIILSIHQGELKEDPSRGVGIADMLLDDDPLQWRLRIREQLEMDGQKVESITINSHSIDIQSTY